MHICICVYIYIYAYIYRYRCVFALERRRSKLPPHRLTEGGGSLIEGFHGFQSCGLQLASGPQHLLCWKGSFMWGEFKERGAYARATVYIHIYVYIYIWPARGWSKIMYEAHEASVRSHLGAQFPTNNTIP